MKVNCSTVFKTSIISPTIVQLPSWPFCSFVHLSILLHFIFTVRNHTYYTNSLNSPPENKSQRMWVYRLKRQKVCHSRLVSKLFSGQQDNSDTWGHWGVRWKNPERGCGKQKILFQTSNPETDRVTDPLSAWCPPLLSLSFSGVSAATQQVILAWEMSYLGGSVWSVFIFSALPRMSSGRCNLHVPLDIKNLKYRDCISARLYALVIYSKEGWGLSQMFDRGSWLEPQCNCKQ